MCVRVRVCVRLIVCVCVCVCVRVCVYVLGSCPRLIATTPHFQSVAPWDTIRDRTALRTAPNGTARVHLSIISNDGLLAPPPYRSCLFPTTIVHHYSAVLGPMQILLLARVVRIAKRERASRTREELTAFLANRGGMLKEGLQIARPAGSYMPAAPDLLTRPLT